MIAAGIGCRQAAPASDVVAAVRAAEARAGVMASVLAVPVFRAMLPGVADAAAALALDLRVVDAAAMDAVQDRCLTRSAVALRETGFAAVAEAAALAGAGPGARLLGPRLAVGQATCALAESAP